jgi:GTP-binding protein EngB required for normal cell division
LIDSRHGPVAQDEVVMSMMSNLPKHVKYVIVLTKVDKKDSKHVLQENINSIKSKLVKFGKFSQNEHVPILLTSSLSRIGRNDVWRHLRHAASSSSTEK